MSGMDDAWTIRPAERGDLAGIDDLLARSYPVLLKDAYPPSTLVTAIPLIARANPGLIASGTYFVVTAGREILGAGGWTSAAPGTGRRGAWTTGHIRHVVTDHRRVRSGIGRALMTHICADAKGAGMTRLECLSTLMAVRFYAACGFVEVGPVAVNLRPGIDFPAVLMTREL